MSRFIERDWHSLLITASVYAWLLLHTGTDGDNKPISAASFSQRVRESPPRKADLLLLYLSEPTHCWISTDSRSSQPTAVFLCDAVHTHTPVWRCIMVEAVYTNPLFYSPCPVHHTSLYLCYLYV